MKTDFENLQHSRSYQLSKYTENNPVLEDSIIELSDMLEQTKKDTGKLVDTVLNYYHYRKTSTLPEIDSAIFQAVVHVTQPFRIPYMTYRFDKYIDFLMKHGTIKSILDYGGGGGKDSIILAKLGYTVTYADITGPLTPLIKKRFELRGLNNHITDVRFLGSKQYDCIVSLDVLEHIYDLEYALADIYAHLRPGGVLICHPTFINTWDGDHIEKNCAYLSFFHNILSRIGFKSEMPRQKGPVAILIGFLQQLKIVPRQVTDYCLIKGIQYSESIEVEQEIVRKKLYKLSRNYSLKTLFTAVLFSPVSLACGLLFASLPIKKTRFVGKVILAHLYDNIADNLAVCRLSSHRLSELDHQI